MSTTGLDSFDTTVQKTNLWLKELMDELGWSDRQGAYLALRAVLHTLRDRLTVEEAVELGAQLPMLVRGFYYEGWNPSGKPSKMRNKEEFLSRIRSYFPNEPDIDAEAIASAVFRLLSMKVDRGEIEDVKGILPADIRDLWEEWCIIV